MVLKNFEAYLFSCGYKDNTIDTYTSHIKQYLIWADINLISDSDELLRSHFLHFRKYLKVIRENAVGSIKVKTHAMKKFNEFLVENNVQPSTVIGKEDNINLYHSDLSFITPNTETVMEFISKLEENEPLKYSILAKLLSSSGIKISECLNLKGSSIGKLKVSVIQKDGTIFRVVEISSELESQLRLLSNGADAFLFSNAEGFPIHRSRVNQVFKKRSEDITPSVLRHYYCHQLYLAGENASVISKKMGNASEQLIRHYMAHWSKMRDDN